MSIWDQRYAGEDYFYGTEPSIWRFRICVHTAVSSMKARAIAGCLL